MYVWVWVLTCEHRCLWNPGEGARFPEQEPRPTVSCLACWEQTGSLWEHTYMLLTTEPALQFSRPPPCFLRLTVVQAAWVHCGTHTGLKLMTILLSQTPKCWDYNHEPLYTAQNIFLYCISAIEPFPTSLLLPARSKHTRIHLDCNNVCS